VVPIGRSEDVICNVGSDISRVVAPVERGGEALDLADKPASKLDKLGSAG
jgi:hypothetical protein